ncbi:TPA: hypothetical protein HA265_02385 [Candidatus Woesearchaeota archaeon]|nr:hypothetical protein [Candidatus Woesearchaeota archaeon]
MGSQNTQTLEERSRTERPESLSYMLCPEGHGISLSRDNYAKDFSDGKTDANCMPMFESGLWCYRCERAYGLSKLREPEKE